MRANGASIGNFVANLCLLLVSCVAGLTLCELSLRLFYPKYAPLAASNIRRDAMRLWARAPNYRHWHTHPDTGSPHFFHHNNLALRQHRNFSAADLAATTNVGVFGDSFLENVRLPAPYSFTEPLDYLLNPGRKRFNVLNFGVNGYGPGQSFLHYEHFRHAADLDHVLFVFCQNDLRNLYETGLFHLDEAGQLVQNELLRSSRWTELIGRLHVPYLLLDARGHLASYVEEEEMPYETLKREHGKRKRDFDRLWNEDDQDFQKVLATFRQLIRRWKHLAEQNGSTFSVVLLPDRQHAIYPLVAALLTEDRVQVIDLYECFNSHDASHSRRSWFDGPYSFKRNFHWNEAGNRLAAICLYRFLEAKMRQPVLSEDDLEAALHRYYAAFGGWMPRNAGGKGHNGPPISSPQAIAIRDRYQALDALSVPMSALADASDKRIIRSAFSVYLNGKSLIYYKEGCRLADLPPPFFLHLIPVDGTDLPRDRFRYGFDNRDFYAESFEVDGDGCATEVLLPDYAIRHIRTGQHVPDKGPLWEGESFIGRPGFDQD